MATIVTMVGLRADRVGATPPHARCAIATGLRLRGATRVRMRRTLRGTRRTSHTLQRCPRSDGLIGATRSGDARAGGGGWGRGGRGPAELGERWRLRAAHVGPLGHHRPGGQR
eukprot:scaffold543_cov312-Prasinococcus_capsulatus_cf.AAC.13